MMSRSSRLLLVLGLPLAAVVAACAEDLDTGATCPLLCPGQNVALIDTVLEPAYTFDSTFVGFPLQGLDASILLATWPDTFDVRGVVRFDTLVRTYIPVGGDTMVPIVHVDSAYLTLRVTRTSRPLPRRFSIEVYDVFDSTVADTIPTDLLPHFTLARLLGSVSFDSATFSDSARIRIPLDSAKLREILGTESRRLHAGLRLLSSDVAELRVTPYLPGGDGPRLEYRIDPDTAVEKVAALQPSSITPRSPGLVAGDFVDFQIVANAPDLMLPGRFVAGGLPGARTYIRFDLPRWLTDSVGVIRARLELVQDPLYGPGRDDTLTLVTHLVVAGNELTDLRRATTLLTAGGIFANTLRILPSDSGLRTIEMNTLVRLWATSDGKRPLPTAIVLRSNDEGSSPVAARFFSYTAADPTLRPRLRVTYTPGAVFGRP